MGSPLLATVLLLTAATPQALTRPATFVPLGVLPGMSSSGAWGVDRHGTTVVGNSETGTFFLGENRGLDQIWSDDER